jgi:hypothetical protein
MATGGARVAPRRAVHEPKKDNREARTQRDGAGGAAGGGGGCSTAGSVRERAEPSAVCGRAVARARTSSAWAESGASVHDPTARGGRERGMRSAARCPSPLSRTSSLVSLRACAHLAASRSQSTGRSQHAYHQPRSDFSLSRRSKTSCIVRFGDSASMLPLWLP